jgi:RimJ/RimL family protein N-acetyltransferase
MRHARHHSQRPAQLFQSSLTKWQLVTARAWTGYRLDALTDFRIRPLGLNDAQAVAQLITADPLEYRRHFEPFPSGRADVDAALEQAQKDSYWGFFLDDELVALVMLRGLDAGFAAPAFGAYVAARYASRGLATAGLAWAEAWCRLNDVGEIMLTVHPDHFSAQRLYEANGFVDSGEQSTTGHCVYRKHLDRD